MANKRNQVRAVAYLRTSSAANVGDGKDSEARQRRAIESYAKRAGIVIVDWFDDAAVSGADPIESRPGFAAALTRIAGNGAAPLSSRPPIGSPAISWCRKLDSPCCATSASLS
jgi:hypothetical protein